MADTQDSFEMFLQLDDLKGDSKANAEATLEAYRADRGEWEPEPDHSNYNPEDDAIELQDFSDINDDFRFEDEDGFEGEESEESEEEEAAEESVEEEAEAEEGEVEYEEGEAYDVDYDTVITLPDGRDMSIEELANGYMAGSDYTAREAGLQEKISQFEERVASMQDVLQLSQLEADRVINDYENFDWDALAANDPQAFVENKRFLERYQARKQELINAQQRLVAEANAKQEEAYKAQCVECVNVLKKEIPNWDEPLYQNLMEYAIKLGASEDEILKENRPSVFIALHKAMQFDHGRSRVMAKIKRPGAPKRVTTPGVQTPASDDSGKRAQAAKAYASGKMSQADAFSFLED